MDSKRFADHTQRFLNDLPHWFEMRQDQSSVGARFLNVVGLEYDELSLALSKAEDELYLETASVDGLDMLYKILIPVHLDASKLTKVFSDHYVLERATSIHDFKTVPTAGELDLLQVHHPYFLDEEKNILYVRQSYDSFEDCPYGRLSYVLEGETYEQALKLHHVWNFLDEFGLLLCCPRLTEETNDKYKRRLLDVFKHPAGANKTGLLNGIGRELSLRRHLTWNNPAEPLVLPDAMIILNTIEVNNKVIDEAGYIINEMGQVELVPNLSLPGATEVTYLHGIEMHQLSDKRDDKLQLELLNLDNTASDLLKYYVERIHLESPINWGHFKWDESYWDTSNQDVTGLAFIPNLQDARINGFSDY